ncbi:MAG: hypothetical protein JWN78_2468 [Bacteroidota bacterium]|nr:hypothetical protein [Bacteroidota bacterium]
MTLHTAIEKLLMHSGHPMTTQDIANDLNKNGWYKKADNSAITAFQIQGRTRNYPNLFNSSGSIVSLTGLIKSNLKKDEDTSVSNKDEHYVLDLCDKILGLVSLRQHKFDFLLGDENLKGIARKLPVDSYYEKLNLVIEYCEKQHSETVTFFDKPDRLTVSGVHRGEQRKIYDERRRQLLPIHNINLVEISYSDFNHDRRKKIIRDYKTDEKIIRKKLVNYLK